MNKTKYNPNLKLETVSETDWNIDLKEFKYSIFLTSEWLNAMQNENTKPVYFNFILNDKVVGKLSGFVCFIDKIRGTQLYFYASVALKEFEQTLYDNCHAAIYKFAKVNNYTRIIIGSYDQQHTLICKARRFFTTKRFEYVVNLETNLKFNRNFTRSYKRAENFGLQCIHENSEEMLNKLFELLFLTKEHRVSKYGSDYNPLFLRYLTKESMQRLIKTNMTKLCYVAFNNDIHIVTCYIEENNRISGLLLGSDNFSYQMGLPAFITATMFQKFKDNNIKYYNSGGGTKDAGNKGLEQFKQSMGGEKIFVFGATTNFITFPRILLNPLMNLGRIIPDNNPIVAFIKNKFT
ncbi:MAG: hypothetical protein FWH18_05850 [Marinilabiliaceae bacterium]|nr:hypothetical protein [Marinilabiliaceae bacterium]